jgi:hypothetical protein
MFEKAKIGPIVVSGEDFYRFALIEALALVFAWVRMRHKFRVRDTEAVAVGFTGVRVVHADSCFMFRGG